MSEGLKKVGNYRLVRKIGSGATSEVFEGRKEGEIERFAIKMIKVRSMSKEQREMIAKEVVIIKSIDHAHIVKLHDTLQTPNNYYLVFEFCERGDLEKYLKQNMDNLLPPDNVRKIIGCIADALRHLHARGIAHRDIKLANVLLKKDFTIKLADFGFARQAGGEEVMMQTYCGTPITMAPEILQGRPYDKKCDIWSLGVILFQLVFGKLPFPIDQGYVVFINKVTTERVKLPPQPKISNSLAELLYACLERDQIKRLSIEEFLESGWMKEAPSNQTQQCQKNQSVSQVLKRVSKEKHCEAKEQQAIQKERVQLQKLERMLASRIYEVLCGQLGKILNRHVALRSELGKLVSDIKQLRQVLWYYDSEILRKIYEKRIKMRMEGDKDVFIPVSSLKALQMPQPLSQQPQQCQASIVLMNYLKKLSLAQEFDNQRKKLRYQILIKFLDFIQNFEMDLVLIFTNGFQSDITLARVAANLENCAKLKSERQDEQQQQKEYCPWLNHITIALQCRQKEQKFRQYANALKASCQKRLDAIQREINGY